MDCAVISEMESHGAAAPCAVQKPQNCFRIIYNVRNSSSSGNEVFEFFMAPSYNRLTH